MFANNYNFTSSNASQVSFNWDSLNFLNINFNPYIYFSSSSANINTFNLFNILNVYTLSLLFFMVLVFYLLKNNFFIKTLTICEEEINSSDDFLLIFMFVFFFFFFNFYGLFSLNFCSVFQMFVSLFAFFFISLFLMPLTALYVFGFYFIINIKGSGASLSYLYEIVQDNINLLSFFLRIYIQLVRLITITVTYFGYNHLTLSYNFSVLDFNLSGFFITFARFMFELVHTIIIFIAQSLSLVMMVLWLFQFLFTVFVNKELEYTYKKI